MVNVELVLYPTGGKAVTRQITLTEDGYVEIQRLGEEERKRMVCSLARFDTKNISRVEVRIIKEEE